MFAGVFGFDGLGFAGVEGDSMAVTRPENADAVSFRIRLLVFERVRLKGSYI